MITGVGSDIGQAVSILLAKYRYCRYLFDMSEAHLD